MPISGVRGITSSNNAGFLRFFALVQDEAAKRGRVFFIGDVEGHDLTLGDLYLAEICGWLVPKDLADEFEAIWMTDKKSIWGSWWSQDFFVFEDFDVEKDGSIDIRFWKHTDDDVIEM